MNLASSTPIPFPQLFSLCPMGFHTGVPLLLLLLVASVSAHWAPGIPTGWQDAPSTIAGFPNATADPWRYADRLGLYKTLVTASSAALGGWQDPIWGLPLQFSWQHDTGRLLWSAQSNTSNTDRVNASSWWGT